MLLMHRTRLSCHEGLRHQCPCHNLSDCPPAVSRDSTSKPSSASLHRGGCEHCPHKHSTYRVAQHDLTSSREHAWLKSWKAQHCTSLSLEQLSSICHVTSFAAPVTDHKHKFSHPFHPHLPPFRRSHLCT